MRDGVLVRGVSGYLVRGEDWRHTLKMKRSRRRGIRQRLREALGEIMCGGAVVERCGVLSRGECVVNT